MARTAVTLTSTLTTAKRVGSMPSRCGMSGSFPSGLVDELLQAVQLLLGQACVGALENGGDGPFGRALEKSPEKMGERRASGSSRGDGGHVDVAGSILLVARVPLFFQDSEEGTDG